MLPITALATWLECPGYICLTETTAQKRPADSGSTQTELMPGIFICSSSVHSVAVRVKASSMCTSVTGRPWPVAQSTGLLRCRICFTSSAGLLITLCSSSV